MRYCLPVCSWQLAKAANADRESPLRYMTPLDKDVSQPDLRYCFINWSEYPCFFSPSENNIPPGSIFISNELILLFVSIAMFYNTLNISTAKIYYFFDRTKYLVKKICIILYFYFSYKLKRL